VEKSIYLDAHYKQLLGIDNIGCAEYGFELRKARWWRYYLNAFRYHPDDGVRTGTFIGVCSLILALASIFLGVISLWQ